jgi:hypothetical protein
MILVAMTITVVVATVETVADTHQHGISVAKIFVGGFLATGMLLGLSYFLPEFAGGLAVVAMVTTLVDRGKTFSELVTKVTGAKALPGAGGNPNVPSVTGTGQYSTSGDPMNPPLQSKGPQ